MINIDNYLRINIVDMSMVLVSTFLIVLIAKKFFWKYAQDYITKRHDFIQKELDDAAEKSQEAIELRAQAAASLDDVHLKANEIISAAETNAKKEAKSIVNNAHDEADKIKEKAKADIEKEKMQVQAEMKEEMSNIALLAASEVVKKDMNDDTHRKYVEDFIKEAGESKWQA